VSLIGCNKIVAPKLSHQVRRFLLKRAAFRQEVFTSILDELPLLQQCTKYYAVVGFAVAWNLKADLFFMKIEVRIALNLI
jgi:hypothetical protein